MPFLLLYMIFCIKFILCEATVSIKNQKIFICLAACYNIEYELYFSIFVFFHNDFI